MTMLLGELLVKMHGVKQGDIDRALNFQQQYGGKLGSILVNMGILDEDTLVQALSCQLNLKRLCEDDLEEVCDWQTAATEMPVDMEFFISRKSFPLRKQDGNWLFASVDPLNLEINSCCAECGIDPCFLICTETQFRELSIKLKQQNPIRDYVLGLSDLNSNDVEKLRELASEAPIVNLLNSFIARAIGRGASDLHFEPYKSMYRVRFRIDGLLHDVDFLPREMELAVVSRVKVLAGLDIAEKRKPQDGKISMRVASREVDIRVSTLPLGQGESLVLRFLLKESIRYDLDVLGLEEDLLNKLNGDICKTSGVILLTGPTGSGKTTTLYSALNQINREDRKIITVEDPIEYQLEGINQVQVNSDIGYDFPNALRSIVRQDPDVIMIGEIRDRDTSKIAMQASLTGHLVFSTLHTNDAPSAFTRLLDLGVEDYLLNAALVSIIAQRLVRKLCPHCKEKVADALSLIRSYEMEHLLDIAGRPEPEIYRPVGCSLCEKSGYKGRVGIMEYMSHDNALKTMEKDAHFVYNARKHMRENGVRNLMEDGMLKALKGITSVEEVVRVAG